MSSITVMILSTIDRIRHVVGCALALLLLARTIAAQAAPPPAPADPIPPHDTFTVASRAVGEARRINVHVPSGYTASATTRFPVLYMPDGGLDEDFPHVVNTVDSLISLGAIRPVIVVGIPNTERRRDLTGPTRVHSDSTIAPHVGGSAAFRRFIRDELMPVVRQRYRTTDERSIVGESLAGLFIVETFLLEPAMFDRYVAFDPSVWWNNGALVDSAAAHIALLDNKPRTLFIGTSADMTDVAARLATLLRGARPALTFEYAPRADLTHATIFRALAPQALARSLR